MSPASQDPRCHVSNWTFLLLVTVDDQCGPPTMGGNNVSNIGHDKFWNFFFFFGGSECVIFQVHLSIIFLFILTVKNFTEIKKQKQKKTTVKYFTGIFVAGMAHANPA